MPSSASSRHDGPVAWTLRREGTEHEVREGTGRRVAVLTADGAVVDEQETGYWEKATLRHVDLEVEVQWGPRNRITSVVLLGGDDVARLPFAPPPGSLADRRERLAREHPVRFTLLRVASAGAGVLIGVLGVGALVSALVNQLLPRIDLSWLPTVSWPDAWRIDPPDWLRHLDLFSWVRRLPWPDWSLPTWLTGYTEYWIPLVVAGFIAVGEVDRRRKQHARRADDPPAEDPSADHI